MSNMEPDLISRIIIVGQSSIVHSSFFEELTKNAQRSILEFTRLGDLDIWDDHILSDYIFAELSDSSYIKGGHKVLCC